jgi:hypothetical protein
MERVRMQRPRPRPRREEPEPDPLPRWTRTPGWRASRKLLAELDAVLADVDRALAARRG